MAASKSETHEMQMKLHFELSTRLFELLDSDPAEAVRQAKNINLDQPERFSWMGLKAVILVDGGALIHQQDAIEEGLVLFRELHSRFQDVDITYNLANGIVAAVGNPPRDSSWLDHQERTKKERAEARLCYSNVAKDLNADPTVRTQALTNLASQFSHSFRLAEAHDARLAALKIDPENGVAASSAALDLLWLYSQGGCSDLTRIEAIMLAKISCRYKEKLIDYVGVQAAQEITEFASQLGEAPPRSRHVDPFVIWVEHERLTLAPAVELIDPSLGKLDWLMLPGIMVRNTDSSGTPPPVFAMFNMLKSDFILARDLAWRATDENVWPKTGRFADTLDYAIYGPAASAHILAHRTALDLLDKVAVMANHYFELGLPPDRIYFGKIWRCDVRNAADGRPLSEKVAATIRSGVNALYGLVELADDYESKIGILRSQKNLRNIGTHRFVVLHDLGDPTHCRQTQEIEHQHQDQFSKEALAALRVARSAIQMLALAITQNEKILAAQVDECIGTLHVPDHDWIRGRN